MLFLISYGFPKHILTSAECVATNKDDLRGNYGTVGPIEANFVLECNLFALIGYDSVEEAVRYDAQLRRIEALTPHDESFKQGYSIGDYQYGQRKAMPSSSGQCKALTSGSTEQ